MPLWIVVHQAPLSMGFSRQEYWSGLSCPPPGDHPNPGIKPRSPALQADSLPTEPPGKPYSVQKSERIESGVCVCVLSHVQLFAIPRIVAHQAPLSMGFSRQEYWSGLPFPTPGDLPDPGIELRSPTLQADSLPTEPPEKLEKV